ncbi:hypothetical protein PC9H_011049 [Pleurotus ostreatus]|uniref:Uncharacterized protein n=1 Tax=Pleurotus ostreatus TaxID=5322 RepID=A0A8H6ZL05_PLEOS|nr:uncharacterized protein PC9H_011049 [Pleurotus ostreatus]KAF7422885.1 hypothetical protein PC9H_011049 [Pleurotus ostreatus]
MNDGAAYLPHPPNTFLTWSYSFTTFALVVIAALALSVAGAPVENSLIKGPPPPDDMSVCGKIAYTAKAIKETIKDKLRGCLKIGGSAMG